MIDQLEAFLTQFAGTLGALVTIAGIIWAVWRRVAKPATLDGYRRAKEMFATFEAIGQVAQAQLAPVDGGAPLVELVAQIPDLTAAQVRTTDALKELTTIVLENHEDAGRHWQRLEDGHARLSQRLEEVTKPG